MDMKSGLGSWIGGGARYVATDITCIIDEDGREPSAKRGTTCTCVVHNADRQCNSPQGKVVLACI